MILVRSCFVAKPGCASKLAAQFKEAIKLSPFLAKARVMTDVTGDFNRVIMEHEAKDLAEFEAAMKDYASNQAVRDAMKGYTDLYLTGTREVLQIL